MSRRLQAIVAIDYFVEAEDYLNPHDDDAIAREELDRLDSTPLAVEALSLTAEEITVLDVRAVRA